MKKKINAENNESIIFSSQLFEKEIYKQLIEIKDKIGLLQTNNEIIPKNEENKSETDQLEFSDKNISINNSEIVSISLGENATEKDFICRKRERSEPSPIMKNEKKSNELCIINTDISTLTTLTKSEELNKNRSSLRYLIKKYSYDEIIKEIDILKRNKKNKISSLNQNEKEKILSFINSKENFNLDEELIRIYTRNLKEKEEIEKGIPIPDNIEFENEISTNEESIFTFNNDDVIYGKHYFKSGDKIYSFRPLKNKNSKKRITMYCTGKCDAKIAIYKEQRLIAFIGEHSNHNGINKTKLKEKFPSLFRHSWNHAQVGIRNEKEFILYTF